MHVEAREVLPAFLKALDIKQPFCLAMRRRVDRADLCGSHGPSAGNHCHGGRMCSSRT